MSVWLQSFGIAYTKNHHYVGVVPLRSYAYNEAGVSGVDVEDEEAFLEKYKKSLTYSRVLLHIFYIHSRKLMKMYFL